MRAGRIGGCLLATVLLGLVSGCAGVRSPFSRSPAEPDSTAIRARLQEERLDRLEQASAEQGRLLRRMSAEQSAQLETLLAEVRALGERLTTIERRVSTPRREPEGYPTPPVDAGAGAVPGGASDARIEAPPDGGAPPVANESVAPSGGAELPDPSEEGTQLYQAAYQELMEDNYQLALSDLRVFLERFPRTRLSDNAQYWIGEVYYEQKQFSVAVDEFRRVIDEYPDQDKVPAAYYKLALSFRALRDPATARRYLDLLTTRYPDSREAQLAKERRSEF
jgi:tol-pal system protein YbgF